MSLRSSVVEAEAESERHKAAMATGKRKNFLYVCMNPVGAIYAANDRQKKYHRLEKGLNTDCADYRDFMIGLTASPADLSCFLKPLPGLGRYKFESLFERVGPRYAQK